MSRLLRSACLAACLAAGPALGAETRQVAGVTPNPGNLLMYEYVPDDLPSDAPLVVALHGCTQSAKDFDDESGWTGLAERYHFALLLPEQQQANSEDRCFNWFPDEDNHRDRGEAASIKAMIDRMVADHGVDRGRVFVTGFSAGGAMTAVMLATYPEVFAGGAVIAGVPYGCANTDGEPFLTALKRTFLATNPYGEAGWAAYACGITRLAVPFRFTPFDRQPEAWADLVRRAGAATPPAWPKVLLWQGDDDQTVHPMNLQELLDQWTAVEGIDEVPEGEDRTATYHRREFADATGEVRVEAFDLPALGHAVPVDPRSRSGRCGKAGGYFVDRHVCAALQTARFWGLTDER
jgi:poly(hydroxyalkanoate) depolymerase family esterase